VICSHTTTHNTAQHSIAQHNATQHTSSIRRKKEYSQNDDIAQREEREKKRKEDV